MDMDRDRDRDSGHTLLAGGSVAVAVTEVAGCRPVMSRAFPPVLKPLLYPVNLQFVGHLGSLSRDNLVGMTAVPTSTEPGGSAQKWGCSRQQIAGVRIHHKWVGRRRRAGFGNLRFHSRCLQQWLVRVFRNRWVPWEDASRGVGKARYTAQSGCRVN
jgi:hypothetical protein